ncbi:MAG: hypothetical protein E3J69_10290 [Anaerolineales bacterium]|nr:MAG: hypothetical protein E3J69_10290 [Anaerolineales bacterium]
MSELFLSSMTHVIPITVIRRERVLPVPGAVLVRVNERIQAADIVAEAEIEPKHYYLDVDRGLGISIKDAGRYITCQKGDRVETGDVLAGPAGVPRRTVRAPAAGRIVGINSGRILLESFGQVLQIKAGFPGKVISSDGAQAVTIEAIGTLIQGVWGNGLQNYGVMRLVGDGPSSRLQTDQLDVNLRGAVLVAGICDHPAPFHQATELSVRGVILGGMPSELIPVARRLPYPVLLTEGFGEHPINAAAFNLFVSNVGREVAVDAGCAWPQPGQRPEAIIPQPSSRQVSHPDRVISLKPGVRVRVLKPPYQGEVAVVKEILKRVETYPSGIRAKSATIEIDGVGTKTVPLANIEILQ